MIITIDGPSGVGKSTLAKRLAQDLGIKYLNTGAMYRAISLLLLKKNIDIENEEEVRNFVENENFLKNFDLKLEGNQVYLNGKDITNETRSQLINDTVSKVSSYQAVRTVLIQMQRQIAKNQDIILDGRDTGTVVFPGADFKIYLTASVEERANRRHLQDPSQDYESVLESIKNRDYQDMNREISPLKIPEGAFILDTSEQNVDESIDAIKKSLGDRGNAI